MNAALSWDDLKLLEALAAAGSYHAVAHQSSVDATTIARRVERMERRLGTAVFERVDGRLQPTPIAQAALPSIVAMREAAESAAAALLHTQAELSGQVRVSSLGFIQSRWLAPALGLFHQAHPKVTLALMAEDRSISFERREADIAIRLGRPDDNVARIRKLGTLEFSLYMPVASQHAPESGNLPVVRYDASLDHLPEMQMLDTLLPDAPVILRSSRLDVLMSTALATGAALMLPEQIGDSEAGLERHPSLGQPVKREAYLMMHPDRIETPSVRAVADWIITLFAKN
ncbi:MAG: LysR family transcriptional regulator [Beijerinckiaceae bacterium]